MRLQAPSQCCTLSSLFQASQLCQSGGRGELDACTLDTRVELWALTPSDQEALGKAKLLEVTS